VAVPLVGQGCAGQQPPAAGKGGEISSVRRLAFVVQSMVRQHHDVGLTNLPWPKSNRQRREIRPAELVIFQIRLQCPLMPDPCFGGLSSEDIKIA
jgi:hypothetical protein